MKGLSIKLVILSLVTVCCQSLWAQNVSNVTAQQVDKNIHISYSLDKAADISVYISANGGNSYRELKQVSGDVGKTIGPGRKTIVWNVLEEMAELVGDDFVFMVRVDGNAEKQWKKKRRAEMPYNTFFTLNAAYSPLPQWSYGFKVGQAKNVGWFVSAMTNFNFKGVYKPMVDGDFYLLNGKHKTARLSAQVGLVVRPCKPLYMLFGVGYGYRTLTMQTYDQHWYSYPARTYHGVDVSFGLLFDIKCFALSAEVVTTNFKTVEAKVGLGFCLPNKKKNR